MLNVGWKFVAIFLKETFLRLGGSEQKCVIEKFWWNMYPRQELLVFSRPKISPFHVLKHQFWFYKLDIYRGHSL